MDLIIGAGISGLSYAAKTPNDYLIVEKDNEIGGYCKTIYSGDYVWDYSGHFFHFQRPEIKDYVMSRLDEKDILKVRKYTQIYYKGIYVDYPFQMNIHQLNKDEFIDCLYDLFTIDDSTEVTSFKKMLFAKFGKSIAEKFLIPYNEKLYATDLDKLDVDAMGRFFPYADKEQIVRNFKNSTNQSYNSFFLYPRKGVIKIVESVASHVDKSKILLGEKLLSVDMKNKKAVTDKRTIEYDNLISTMPFPVLMDKCGVEYDKEVYSWNKVLVFNLGFDKKGPEKQNNWIYFPDRELVFYRVGFYDNIIGQDKTSLYVEIGFDHEARDIDIDQLLDRTLSDLRKVGIITDQKLVASHPIMMDPAYVHITQRSEEDKARKKDLLKQSDVYSIGRYGSWTYCSLEDNIHEAFSLAKAVAEKQ
ncbi:MAG: FAD-dependent oxidoreductase [Bacteroidales bacterium]|nr:FAD-dependent oxidoreductase [Bacteroidales bacterium]